MKYHASSVPGILAHQLLPFQCIQLVIINTLFQQKDRFKATWRHQRPKHHHLLDYSLTRQRNTRDVLHTRVMTSVDRRTNHRLVRCKVAFTLKSPPKRKVSDKQDASAQTSWLKSGKLQRAPRTKAWSWLSKKALQRPAEETACTGGNQLSVMAAVGLRPR